MSDTLSTVKPEMAMLTCIENNSVIKIQIATLCKKRKNKRKRRRGGMKVK
jgi:hypothetical protein